MTAFRSRLDYVVVRQEQDIPDLAIDHTFVGSGHQPLVCTVGTVLESPYEQPKKTFKANRKETSSLSSKQRKQISNRFALLVADLDLDADDAEVDQLPAGEPSSVWRPNFSHDPLSTELDRASLDQTCSDLYDAATEAMLQSGTGSMVGPRPTHSGKRRISKTTVSLLNKGKRARAKLRRAEHRLVFRRSETTLNRHKLRKSEAQAAKDKADTFLRDERQKSWRKFVTGGCSCLFKGGERGKGDPARHWAFVRKVIGGRSSGAGSGDVLLPSGDVASGDTKVLVAWSSYLDKLFSDTANNTSRGSEDMWGHEFCLVAGEREKEALPQSALPLTWHELCLAANKMKRGKAPGSSGIPLEFWTAFMPTLKDISLFRAKHGPNAVLQPEGSVNIAMWNVVSKIVKSGHIPLNMTNIASVWLHKKGDKRDPSNYRGIALIEPLLKLVATAFAKRAQNLLECRRFFRTEQGGFRREEETGSQLVPLWEICTRRKVCGLRTYIFFSDLKKAFDTVGHQALLRKLHAAGVRGDALRFFTALYRRPRIGARLSCGTTDMIRYLRGVLQGCPASPTCFITYINDAFDTLERECGGVAVPGMRLTADDADNGVLEVFLGLLFADDAVTSAHSIPQMEKVLLVVESWAKAWDLTFGIPKCGLMVISPDDKNLCASPSGGRWSTDMQELLEAKLTLDDTIVPVVEAYEYLGFLFRYDLDLKPGVLARAAAVRKRRVLLRKFLGSISIPVGCRVIVLNAMVAPVATYAGELLGMCMTGKGYDLIEPIVKQFTLAVELVIRGSWNVRENKKSKKLPMGTVRAAAYDQYGIRDIEAVFAQLRARAYLKWPRLKTWIHHLAARPLDCKTSYTIKEPGDALGDSKAVKVGKRATANLWFTKTKHEIGLLAKWDEDAVQKGLALACYVFPFESDPNQPAESLRMTEGIARDGEKCYSRRVFHAAAARLRTRALHMGTVSQADTVYFKSRHLHLTPSLFRRMSMRNLGLERGYHWLARARCGAFICTKQAVAADIIKKTPGTLSNCAVCKKSWTEDSLAHFLFRCNPSQDSELSQLRIQHKLRKVANVIRRIACKHLSVPHPNWTDNNLVSILLGGQHGEVGTANLELQTKLIQKSDMDLLCKAYGGKGWLSSRYPLAEVAMHTTAQFLHSAMPLRNAVLWQRLTPRMLAASARAPLGRSHKPG